ncbi:MAG TPA: DNA recombination protein RmuC [Erysipelotrichaceae bacterium]|nr:DNA recombination protein RmuC [Erysipelotrichaceae bacterium]
MEYIISIVLSSLILAAVIVSVVLIFVYLKKSKATTTLDLKEIGVLQQQINSLTDQLKTNIELSVVKEMNKVLEQTNKTSEMSNEKLERFQTNITESLASRFDALNKQIETKLFEINKRVDDRLAEGFKTTSETITQVRERLKAIDTAQRNIEKLSEDVISLRSVLEGNQSRGQYGEYQLSMVLHNVFGDTTGCYKEQYTLKKGKDGNDVRADAIVYMPEPNKMICIDSKFPFQDYQRIFDTDDADEKTKLTKDFGGAVKKHITSIKDKYIIPGKTAPEALMFIPNDGVFAFIHHNLEDVVEYARKQRIILTSPSTLPAILVTINMVRIEVARSKNAEEINRHLHRLAKDFEMFEKDWNKFSTALERTTKQKDMFDQRVGRLTGKFQAIATNSNLSDEPIQIAKKDEEEA